MAQSMLLLGLILILFAIFVSCVPQAYIDYNSDCTTSQKEILDILMGDARVIINAQSYVSFLTTVPKSFVSYSLRSAGLTLASLC